MTVDRGSFDQAGFDRARIIVTAAQMQAIEARVFAAGMPVAALMENVAGRITQRVRSLFVELFGPGDDRAGGRSIGILAGPGHNGGDALVVARQLHFAGWQVAVYQPFDRLKDLTAAHAAYGRSLGISIGRSAEDLARVLACSAIIDGLFGFGLERPIGGEVAAAIDHVNHQSQAAAVPVIAIDLPSGLHTDTGAVLGTAIRASHTLCLGLWKRGLVQDPSLPWAGQVELLPFDIPAADVAAVVGDRPALQRWTPQADRYPLPRSPLAHKYQTGRLGLIVGSDRYPGAAILAGLGARAGGAGMVTIAAPAQLKPLLVAQLPEMLVVGCPETPTGAIADLPATWAGATFDAIACGCGLTAEAWPIVTASLASDRPLILDADGLTILAGLPPDEGLGRLADRAAPTILTPHPGEFERLFPGYFAQHNGDRLAAAQQAAQSTGAIVLLKGARTIIASPDGRARILAESTPALARGGSGDVLTGLIGSLFAGAIAGQFLNLADRSAWSDVADWVATAAAWHARAALALARSRSTLAVDGSALATALLTTGPQHR